MRWKEGEIKINKKKQYPSRQDCKPEAVKKVFSEISQNSQENRCQSLFWKILCQKSHLIKFEKETLTQAFSLAGEFCEKFLRTPFIIANFQFSYTSQKR